MFYFTELFLNDFQLKSHYLIYSIDYVMKLLLYVNYYVMTRSKGAPAWV